jgi:uncharacterized protein RhaS with RHS repeats
LDAIAPPVYNYFRDYDAVTGKYVESDPIGLAGGINTYAYVGGNPITSFDALGLEKDTISDRILALTRQGRTQELRDLLNAGGLSPTQEALAQRALARAGDLIRGGLKRSPSYASELEGYTYSEICGLARGSGELANKAAAMRKLIEQAVRLAGKGY